MDHASRKDPAPASAPTATSAPAQTGSAPFQLPAGYLQLYGGQRQELPAIPEARPVDPHATAAAGVAGAGAPLPHLDRIQSSFGGKQDLSKVTAHHDENAAAACQALGADGFATGNAVAFSSPSVDLHVAAHEAAHVVQQRGGVQLHGGMGSAGDPHERHADAVADRVVAGQSAEDLLSTQEGSGGMGLQLVRKLVTDVPKIPDLDNLLLALAAIQAELDEITKNQGFGFQDDQIWAANTSESLVAVKRALLLAQSKPNLAPTVVGKQAIALQGMIEHLNSRLSDHQAKQPKVMVMGGQAPANQLQPLLVAGMHTDQNGYQGTFRGKTIGCWEMGQVKGYRVALDRNCRGFSSLILHVQFDAVFLDLSMEPLDLSPDAGKEEEASGNGALQAPLQKIDLKQALIQFETDFKDEFVEAKTLTDVFHACLGESQFSTLGDLLMRTIEKDLWPLSPHPLLLIEKLLSCSPKCGLPVLGCLIRKKLMFGVYRDDILRCMQLVPVELGEFALAIVADWMHGDELPELYPQDVSALKMLPTAKLLDLVTEVQEKRNKPDKKKLLVHSMLDKADPVLFGQESQKELKSGEGERQFETVTVFRQYLQQTFAMIQNSQTAQAVSEIIAGLQQAAKFALLTEPLAKDITTGRLQTSAFQLLVFALIEQIQNLGEKGGPAVVIYPTGHSKHATLLAITGNARQLYQVCHYNTGDGIGAQHGKRTVDGREKYKTYTRATSVPKEDVQGEGLWLGAVAAKHGSKMEGTESMYGTLGRLGGKHEEKDDPSVPDLYYELAQNLGTCAWQSIMALLRHYILDAFQSDPEAGLVQYKIVKALMSDAMFTSLTKGLEDAAELVAVAELTLRQRKRYLAYDGKQDPGEVVELCNLWLNKLCDEKKLAPALECIGKVSLNKTEKSPSLASVLDGLYEAMVTALELGGVPLEKVPPGDGNLILSAAFARHAEKLKIKSGKEK